MNVPRRLLRRLSTWALAAIFSAAIASNPLAAQDLEALEDVFPSAARAYAPARCAALYQAMMEWTGQTRMGPDLWFQMNDVQEDMILMSSVVAQQENGGSIEDRIEATLRDMRGIADLYLTRMRNNYATIGQAFGEDRLISGDLGFCKLLAETAS